MSRVSRLVCIWCLALVLPLQGLAAGCLMVCAGSHAPAATAAAPAAGQNTAAPPCHAAEAPVAVAEAWDDDGAAPDAGHRCAACDACGAAPALPSTVPALGEPDAVRETATGVPVRPASVAVAGLERPPRATAA